MRGANTPPGPNSDVAAAAEDTSGLLMSSVTGPGPKLPTRVVAGATCGTDRDIDVAGSPGAPRAAARALAPSVSKCPTCTSARTRPRVAGCSSSSAARGLSEKLY